MSLITRDFDKGRDLILFFTPEAEVLPHFAIQCVIAKNLQYQGYTPVFAFCPALFCRCPVMDMYQLNFESVEENKNKVCLQCATKFQNILQKFGLPWVSLRDYLPENAIEIANQAVKNSAPDRLGLVFDNVPVGKIALGDYAIGTKHWCADHMDEQAVKGWEHYARSIIVSYLAVDNLCEKLPIKRMVRYNEYANNMAARFAGEKHGIPVFSISHASHRGGVDLQRVVIFPKTAGAVLKDELQIWHLWRDLPLSAEMIHEITTDIFERFLSKNIFTYSPAKTGSVKNLRQDLKLTEGKKLLVAFTSSGDELLFMNNLIEISGCKYEEQKQTFPNHLEWLKCLVAHVENSSELELIVRIHPREGVSGRYAGASAHLALLTKEFNKSYKNTHFIWPDEKMSSYDLMEIADVGLTSWSTIGIEMARLGIPVVSAFKHITFPDDDFHKWGGPTSDQYIRTVVERLNWKPTYSSIARAYRSYHTSRLGSAISFADIIPSADFRGMPEEIIVMKEAEILIRTLIQQEDILEINRQRLRDLGPSAAEIEKDAIIIDLKRILWFLCMGVDKPDDLEIFTGRKVQTNTLSCQLTANIYSIADDHMVLETSEGKITRFSPLGCRLVRVLDSQVSQGDSAQWKVTEAALSLLF